MFRIDLRGASRQFWRNKLSTGINLIGLTLGVGACLLIGTIVQYEFSFDTFHPDGARIFHIVTTVRDGQDHAERPIPCALPPMAAAMKKQVPGLETVAPYYLLSGAVVSTDKQSWPAAPMRQVLTTPDYFDILPYEWLVGDRKTALLAPFSVVLTEKMAQQYFGPMSPAQILGRRLIYEDSLEVRVTGIIKDWEGHTDFPYTEFISLSSAAHGWLREELGMDHWKIFSPASRCWVKLAKDADVINVQAALTKVFNSNWRTTALPAVGLERLADIHFADYQQGQGILMNHLPTLYALMTVATLIFLLAVINYVNLSTAQAMAREKETAIRKLMGSGRGRLMGQFLGETFVLTLAATAIGVVIVQPIINIFHDFLPARLKFHLFDEVFLLFLLTVVVVTTLLAGLYPARVLSAASPVISLKGGAGVAGGDRAWLRKALIVFQFAIALIFITSTLIIRSQMNYMLTRDPGFRSDAIVAFPTNDRNLTHVQFLADNIRRLPGVSAVARQNYFPMEADHGYFSIQFEERSEEEIGVFAIKADEHYLQLYGMKLVAGRNLLSSDTLKELVINESLARQLGFATPGQALGHHIQTWNKSVPIVGVVADFHQGSFHEAIGGMVITSANGTDLAVRLDLKGRPPGEARLLLARIEQAWKAVYPHDPIAFTWFDESIAQLYKKEQTLSWLMNIATGLTILISCMGLLGLTLFTVARRTREIGIRKVLGARVFDIVVLMSRDILLLVGLAFVIASPVAWYYMHGWLGDFAYRVTPGVLLFCEAGGAAVGIALLTVGIQTVKAALANPVKVLRRE